MELPYAGLHQLCAPMLDRPIASRGPQRDALGTAFGLSAGPAPDRFLVGLAVLSLLAEVAEDGPLVCLIDDAHGWIAPRPKRWPSSRAGCWPSRSPSSSPSAAAASQRDTAGLPELVLEGLATRTHERCCLGPAPAAGTSGVRERIVAETRGNPLALLELPRGLTPDAVAGGFAVPGARPLASHIEQSF